MTHYNYDFSDSGEEMVVESISEGQSGEDMSSEEHLKHSNSKKWAGQTIILPSSFVQCHQVHPLDTS